MKSNAFLLKSNKIDQFLKNETICYVDYIVDDKLSIYKYEIIKKLKIKEVLYNEKYPNCVIVCIKCKSKDLDKIDDVILEIQNNSYIMNIKDMDSIYDFFKSYKDTI